MLHPLTMPARPNRAIITNVALFGALRYDMQASDGLSGAGQDFRPDLSVFGPDLQLSVKRP
jgi:hypothetical protein